MPENEDSSYLFEQEDRSGSQSSSNSNEKEKLVKDIEIHVCLIMLRQNSLHIHSIILRIPLQQLFF